MRLADLLETGVIDDGVTKRSVTWNGKTFDIFVKNEMSASDFEFVFGVGEKEGEHAYSAKQVSRFVRIGPNGEDVIPYETALRMKTSLLLAIVAQINDVHGKLTVETPDPKA